MKTLANDIKNKSFKNAYLLCGEEEYLKLNYKNRLIKSIAGDDTMLINARNEEKAAEIAEKLIQLFQ